MNTSQSKENILTKIRKALNHSTPIPFPESEGNNSVFQSLSQEIEVEFAEQFTKLLGKFIYCAHREELISQLTLLVRTRQWEKVYCCEEEMKNFLRNNGFNEFADVDLKNCDCSITTCEALVARTGSIVLSSNQTQGRTTSVYAPVHICVAFTKQVMYDIKDALQMMKDKYGNNLPSLISFATGPSRTADIEKTLVVGVHGPKEVFLFLVDE